MTDPQDHLPDELLVRYFDGELPEGFDSHVQACAECLRRLAGIREISQALQQYSETLADQRSDPGRRHRLKAALAAEPPSNVPRRRRIQMASALAAMAAALTFALVVRPPSAPRRPSASPDMTSFIELPYSDENLAQEGAVVLQVEVPRSALLLAGIPARDTGPGDLVKAEVVIGADGLARAIRFVN